MPASVHDCEHQEPTRTGDSGAGSAAEVLRSAFGFAKGVVVPEPRAALCPKGLRRVTWPAAALRTVQLRDQSSGEVRGRDGPIA